LIAPLKKLIGACCSLLAALALFGIMWLTLFDVSGRKVLDHSITGSLELTELLMVVVIFAGLPLVSLKGEHVVFDSLDPWLPRGLKRLQHALVDLLCAAALAGLAWVMWTKAGQMAEYGDITPQLQLPLAPFVRVISVLLGLTACVHMLLLFAPVGHHHAGVDEDMERDEFSGGAT
jgi:TRAP-type C4-dicarboxylate transport system permease small subunit